MTQRHFLGLALLLANVSTPFLVHAQDVPKAPAATPKKAAPKPGPQHTDNGQRVFEQNCSRCHATPSGFPPRISGTIVMHMRVRASLSQEDAQALLRFFNP
jgi:cytochrome c5